MAGARAELTLRPLAEADIPELTRIIRTPAVARWWDDGVPWDDPDATMLTIEADGRIAGLIQYAEETDAKYRHASIDIFVDPALHGRGIGTEAIRRLVRHLIEERGHHRITIDPAARGANGGWVGRWQGWPGSEIDRFGGLYAPNRSNAGLATRLAPQPPYPAAVGRE